MLRPCFAFATLRKSIITQTLVLPRRMSSTEIPKGENGEPLSKSALKRLQKEKDMAAKKALKAVNKPAQPAAAPKAKKVVEKKEEEEYPFNDVPAGQKKDLSLPMANGYNPTFVEKNWYSYWEKNGYFLPMVPSEKPTEYSHFDAEPQTIPRNADGSPSVDLSKVNKDKTFVIPAPPPNVTGQLHIGHALAFGLQDTVIRYYRMKGYTALFVPGYDHASISTQSVVEKKLAKTEGLTRHDLGREAFLARCMAWKEEYQARITSQVVRLGASCDWSRVAFTMDENLSKAVAETFVRLHDDGIIYRANRLVNWCVAMNTTLSGLELDQKELKGRTALSVPGYTRKVEFGVITHFKYELADGGFIEVATTRPETILGDVAIAVHPDDTRYTHLHGKFAKHPFLDRNIPIITDSELVDMSFGTGAVKITPAHDANDYAAGTRHNLPFINILNDDGTLNENAGEFAGQKRFDARVNVIEALKTRGLFVGEAENPMVIPVCSKSGDIIEAVMKPQWWVSCKGLAAAAIERTRAGDLTIKPASSEQDWYRWLENIQDWCISRQLWWGHRVPAYSVQFSDGTPEKWVAARSAEDAEAKAKAQFPGKAFTLVQDEDVLDTWFSSGLWPFSIEGWPTETADLKLFYPSAFLETGWDILFFWVARMVLLGVYLTGTVPFKEVFCHAMIRDAHGRKMSKSLGNVIDPIDVIEGATLEALAAQLRAGNLAEKEVLVAEKGQRKDFPKGIPQCGADALRFALCNYTGAGRDINLEILRVEGYRKFCNKLWNATKFAMLKISEPPASERPTGAEGLAERWILFRLNEAARKVDTALAERNFRAASDEAYAFWLYEVCDVYIEAIKNDTSKSSRDTLYTVLDNGLRLLHPFMPFVTEELWQRLPRRAGDRTPSIMLARFPEACEARAAFADDAAQYDLAFSAVRAVRSLAASYNLNAKLQVTLHAKDDKLAATLTAAADSISVLIKGCTQFNVVTSAADIPAGCAGEDITPELAVHLLLKGVIDPDVEIAKATKNQGLAQASLDKLRANMASPAYAKKPENVRALDAAKTAELETKIDTLAKAIEGFLTLKGE